MKKIYCFMMLCIWLWIAIAPNAYAQHLQNNDLERITFKQGLPTNKSRALLQDRKGFLWIGTEEGLSRYDAYDIVNFIPDRKDKYSICDRVINGFFEDTKGNIWIATEKGASFFSYEDGRFHNFLHIPDSANSLAGDVVTSFAEDKQNNIWIGTTEGISIYNPHKNTFSSFDADKKLLSKEISSLLYENGRMWIGTSNGLFLYTTEKKQTTFFSNIPTDPFSISANFITDIHKDKKGTIWIATRNGLNSFDEPEQNFIRYMNQANNATSLMSNFVNALSEDLSGNLWVATDIGICKLNSNYTHFQWYQFADIQDNTTGKAFDVLLTKSGIVWIATEKGGLLKYDLLKYRFETIQNKPEKKSNTLSSNIVWAVAKDRRNVFWVGTGDGLNRYDRKTEQWTLYTNNPKQKNSIPSNNISALFVDKKNKIWIGTFNSGLAMLSDDSKPNPEFLWYQNNPIDDASLSFNVVKSIVEDSYGFLWVGTLSGLNQGYRNKNGEIVKFKAYFHEPKDSLSLTDDLINHIYEDKQKNLWISTNQGLCKGIRQKNGDIKHFIRYQHDDKNPFSLPNDKVRGVWQDASGKIWVGCVDGLVSFDEKKNSFEVIEDKSVYSKLSINALAGDSKGNLWISTTKGLLRYDTQNKRFALFDSNDGLQTGEFNINACSVAADGEMMFGGNAGFNAFYPSEVISNPYSPKVTFTDFYLFDDIALVRSKENPDSPLLSHIAVTKEITLLHTHQVFSIDFSAINFRNPDKNEYAYKLDGFDKQWNYVGKRRFATYSNLPHGEYTFRVKANNSDGIWCNEETTLKIIIKPPFWKTQWFIALSVIAIISGIYMLYRTRVRRIRRYNKRLEKEVKIRTIEIIDSNLALEKKNQQIELHKAEIEARNKKMTDSIKYAKRIQEAMLHNPHQLKEYLKEAFIFFRPRDIVSGDFYWFAEQNDTFVIAAIDCTGHGVPGALMSMAGDAYLNQIVKFQHITDAAQILSELDSNIRMMLRQEESQNQDGMDVALCVVDAQQRKLNFAGAKNPLLRVRNGVCELINANRFSLGGKLHKEEECRVFESHWVDIAPNDAFYIFSDGFQDQFGGDEGRKFMRKNMQKLFENIAERPMNEQRQIVKETFMNWKREHEQIDDVLVIGFKVF